MNNPFRYINNTPEVFRLTVMMYIRYPLSLRQDEMFVRINGETDRLLSAQAAMKVIGGSADQTCERWLSNRAENLHRPFQRRKGAMAKSRDMKTLQKFASAHASTHNHFNLDRYLNRREIFKQDRSADGPSGVSWRPERSGIRSSAGSGLSDSADHPGRSINRDDGQDRR